MLEETGGLFAAAGTLEEAQAAALENLPAIEAAARRALAEAGSDAPVKAELTRMYFNTREYGEDTTLPAGEYQALRLSIGEARGRNWWCVMFPPLCVPAAEAAVEGQESKAAEEDIEALNQEPHYRLSFAVVEWLEELAAE